MSASHPNQTGASHLRVVTQAICDLSSLTTHSILTAVAASRLRRIRMDLEDQASAIRMPTPSNRNPS